MEKTNNKAYELNLRRSLRDAFFFSIMVGLGETYLPAFALAMGLGEWVSGMIVTLPLLVGSVFQLLSSKAVIYFQSYKRWVMLSATIQALSFLPLIWGAYHGQINVVVLFIAASLYWGAGMGAGPAWNAWMGNIVPTGQRPDFWGKRNRMVHSGALMGLVLGGLILEKHTPLSAAFMSLFVIAFLSRSISIYCLSRQKPDHGLKKNRFEIPDKIQLRALKSPVGRIVRYVLFLHLGVAVASPFFAPFMLAELKLSYWQYVLLTSSSFAAKVLSVPFLIKWAEKKGANHVVWLAGLGILILPVLWLVHSSLIYLAIIQFFSGMVWAALDLAFPLVILHMAPMRQQLGLLTLYNSGKAIAVVLGSLAGGGILEQFNFSYRGYAVVFIASTVLRAASALILVTIPIPKVKFAPFLRVLSIRPTIGAIMSPILSYRKTGSAKKNK